MWEVFGLKFCSRWIQQVCSGLLLSSDFLGAVTTPCLVPEVQRVLKPVKPLQWHFLMNCPLRVRSANTFPSIIPTYPFIFFAESLAASKFLHCSTECKQEVAVRLLKDKWHFRHFMYCWHHKHTQTHVAQLLQSPLMISCQVICP